VSGVGFRVSGFGFRVSGFGFSGFGLRVLGFRVSGFGFRVLVGGNASGAATYLPKMGYFMLRCGSFPYVMKNCDFRRHAFQRQMKNCGSPAFQRQLLHLSPSVSVYLF